jgi:hypothetical protein
LPAAPLRAARPPAPRPAPESMTPLLSGQHPLAGTSCARRRTSFIPASASTGRTPRISSQLARRIRRQPPVGNHQRLSALSNLPKPSAGNTAAATNPHRRSSVHAFPRVLSSEAFGRQPYTGSTARARAGIRSPVFSDASRLAVLALEAKLPTVCVGRDGAVGRSPRLRAELHRAAGQVGRLCGAIFRGTSPCELPIEEPPHYAFVINLKTAKALGLTARHTARPRR